jgi:hypothetical protein
VKVWPEVLASTLTGTIVIVPSPPMGVRVAVGVAV